jgi:hypothetical protein
MNIDSTAGTVSRSGAWRRWNVSLVAVLVAVLGVTACGGGSSHHPGVASPSAGGSTQGSGLLAYAACMRSHGVPNFPDPSGGGGISKPAIVSALEAVSSSQAQAAQNACNHLMPAGGLSGQASQTVPAQDQQDYLNAAACMRSHGITAFPDPAFSGGSVTFNIPSTINTNSTQFTQARRICTKLIPAGLPDSGS